MRAVGSRSSDPLQEDAERLARALGLTIREARFEADVLAADALGVPRAKLLAYPELAAKACHEPAYVAALERRLTGEPIAYILGRREFHGLELRVTPAVLIPRPETELLVDLALERLAPHQSHAVLDMGTGSGCIAIAIAKRRPCARVVATDISDEALAVARANADTLQAANLELRQGDCWDAVMPGESFDLITSNPPYIAPGDPHLGCGDLRFEPACALVSSAEGLGMIERIAARAPMHLNPGAWLLVEHGYDQAPAARALFERAGLRTVFSAPDLGGIERVTCGCAPGSP